jgi:hypothetical protein
LLDTFALLGLFPSAPGKTIYASARKILPSKHHLQFRNFV